MYKNYGDANFFEYGRMAELQDDGTVDILVCNLVFNCKDPDRCYQFDHVNVDINDSWIYVKAVENYADVSNDNIIQFALACVDYYGIENFGGTEYYDESQLYTRSEIKEQLKSYKIE